MADRGLIKRVEEPDDPNRCQATGRAGQCRNLAIPGTHYCIAHGGAKADLYNQKKGIYDIRSAEMKARIQAHSYRPDVITLNEEIGVLRITLESLLNQINGDEFEMLTQISTIGEIVMKIEKVVVSCNKLEQSRKDVLSRRDLSSFAAQISMLAASIIEDPAKIKLFVEGLTEVVMKLGNEDEE